MRNRRPSMYVVASIIILSSLAWWAMFAHLERVKPDERIQLFFSVHVNETDIQTDLLENFEDQNIQEISIHTISITNADYDAALLTQGMLLSDILILPTNFITDQTIENFLILDDAVLQQEGTNPSTYTFVSKNEKHYGLIVYDATSNINLLDNYINTSEFNSNSYCLLINNNSPFIKEAKSDDDAISLLYSVIYNLINHNQNNID